RYKSIDVDGKWHEIFADKWIPTTRIYTAVNGDYKAYFTMVSDVTYKIDSGAWKSDIGKPSSVYLEYEVKSDGAQIVINFNAGTSGTG
ncbi:unnamed protein product, partial [marine sediment metagenome]